MARTRVAADSQELWERFPNHQIGFPDPYVTYWRYPFAFTPGTVRLQITGRFPHARYLSFNLYDEAIDSCAALADVQIEPNAGSANPFRPGIKRDLANRGYTLWIVPHGQTRPGVSGNTLEMPALEPGKKTVLGELWYRVYLPDRGTDENGNVALPEIKAFDLAGKPVACPPPRKTTRLALLRAVRNLPPRSPGRDINFYASAARNLYGNPDVHYVTAQLDFTHGAVAMVRFRAPTFPNSATSQAPFDSNRDVRYWSLALGGISGKTSACLIDASAVVASDGFVYVVIGPEEMETEVRARGLNFLPRGKLFIPILIYRNLLANPKFQGNIAKAPTWPPADDDRQDPEKLAFHHFAGDFAPHGQIVSTEEFARSRSPVVCGRKVPPARPVPDATTVWRVASGIPTEGLGVSAVPAAPGEKPILQVGVSWSFFSAMPCKKP